MEIDYGKRIRDARVQKGLSLEDVSFDLKINLKTLGRIEKSQTKDLPKAAFTKGFIKTYCVHLNIDPNLVISEYEKTLDEPLSKLKKGVLTKNTERQNIFVFDLIKNQILPMGILFSIILGVGFAYKSLNTAPLEVEVAPSPAKAVKVKKSIETAAVEKTDQDTGPLEAKRELKLTRVETVYKGQKIEKPKKIVTAPVKVKELIKKDVEAKPVKVIAAPKNKLVVEPLSSTALYIKTDLDESPVKASLKPDVLRTFKFDSAEIRFLDAGAVNLIFNGEDIGALGGFGEEKKIEFPTMKEL